jgi:hypothetical protein
MKDPVLSSKIDKIVEGQQLSEKLKDPVLLATEADYYYFQLQELDIGLALIDRDIDIKGSWSYALQIDILTKSERSAEAIETLKTNRTYVKSNPFLDPMRKVVEIYNTILFDSHADSQWKRSSWTAKH